MLNPKPFVPDATSDLVLQLVADRNRLIATLHHAREELSAHMDVEDGSYGEPRPDWAMRLHDEVDATLRKAGVR